jgi:glycosyltransferase involved in cell wall biosynthesis
MRVGLNLLHSHPNIGWGAWNYIGSLLQALEEYGQSNDYVAYCTSLSEVLVPRKPNFRTVSVGINGENRVQRILYENTLLQWRAGKDRLGCMHWFAGTQAIFSAVPSVVTVYDLRMFDDPKDFPLAYRVYLKTMIPFGVRKAAIVTPMSQSTADSLTRVLGTSPDRMKVIPPPIGGRFKQASAEQVAGLRGKYALPETFWLYVARFVPNKNHERLFKAYSRLKTRDAGTWPLVLRADLFDREELFRNLLAENGIQDDVIWLPRMDEEELPVLYSAATSLIFPSTYEGGGLPLLEAMACGCPAVASDIPTTREFAGEAALIFDPMSVDAIAEAMAIMAGNADLRTRYRAMGIEKARELAPDNVAAKLLQAYECANYSGP